jgi:hypothetical protein
MVQEPYILDAVRRKAVLSSIEEVCRYRGWTSLLTSARIMST